MDTSHTPGAPPHLSPVTPNKTETLKDGFDLDVGTAIGPTQYVFLHAYYDANGNGVEDRGDFAGDLTPTPFEAHDRGLCAGNANRAPDIVLAPVP
jgi:hypothetical protein